MRHRAPPIVVLPRLLDRRRGRWPESRCLHMRALASTRRATWAMTLARRAPTDQHAARWIAAAVDDAERAWRIARRVVILRRQGR
jgi:hypothetical protein